MVLILDCDRIINRVRSSIHWEVLLNSFPLAILSSLWIAFLA